MNREEDEKSLRSNVLSSTSSCFISLPELFSTYDELVVICCVYWFVLDATGK